MPYGKMEEEPWLAWLLRMVSGVQTPGTSEAVKASPWEKLQDLIETAQATETTTHPFLNPFVQQLFPEYIAPQQFTLADIARKMERQVPGSMGTWQSIFAGSPEEIWKSRFQTKPGEIFRPELPVRVRAPEVLEKKQAESIDRFIKEIEAKDFLKAREELDKILGDKKVPFELFKALPEGMKRQMYPKLYPPTKEKTPKWLTEETKALFKGKETRKTETRSYEKKFQIAWVKALEKMDYLPEDKRKFWNSWRINVPKDLRIDVRRALGIPEGITGAPSVKGASEGNQKQVYNECRNAGGTHEECLRRAGVTINR